MSLFDRFRRNRQKSVLPDEIKQYYQAENRQRRGVAVGVALIALIVTLAIAAALFFGGKFVYNQIKGDDNKQESPAGQMEDDGQNQQEGASEMPSSPPETAPSTPAPNPTPTPAPTPAPTTTPSLGDTPLPHTGDEGM